MASGDYEGVQMYPPSQSFRPYHDVSFEDTSDHDAGEDDAFLEKPDNGRGKRRSRLYRLLAGTKRLVPTTSFLSCILSLITTILVIALLLITTKGHPMQIIRETTSSMFKPHTAVTPLHGHGPQAPPPGHKHHGSSHANAGVLDCGSTIAEAKAKGCVFDIMSFAWTPPQCTSPSLSQSYVDKNGPWIFYLDHNATIPLPDAELQDHEVVWTEHSYHIIHCLYAWERAHVAMDLVKDAGEAGKEVLLPGEMKSINHTTHCVELLADLGARDADPKKVNAVAYLVFDSCVTLE